MNRAASPLAIAAVECVCLILIMVKVPLLIARDAPLFLQHQGEHTLTELAQAGLLALSVWLIATSLRAGATRAYQLLLGGLLACMLIRENDALFDRIAHGFWVYPAIAVALAALIVCRRDLRCAFEGLQHHARSRGFVYLLIGMLMVVGFSRLFGTGKLWRAVMQSRYDPAYKNVIQEGLELFGYALVAMGLIIYRLELRAETSKPPEATADLLPA